MEAGQFIALGVMIVVLVVAAVARLKREPIAVTFMKKEDGDDPLRRWARGCYSILFGEASPQRRGYDWCVAALSDSWDIHSGEEALATIQRVSAVPTGHVAWDLVRVVVVARLAAGAGYITQDQAQAAIAGIQQKLQERYSGWEEMAADYDVIVIEKGFGDAYLQHRPSVRAIWNVVPFK